MDNVKDITTRLQRGSVQLIESFTVGSPGQEGGGADAQTPWSAADGASPPLRPQLRQAPIATAGMSTIAEGGEAEAGRAAHLPDD
jgi:hypothetical protein